MSDCLNAEVRDLLPDLLHNQLGPADRERVEAHLRGCAECRAELDLLRRLLAAAPAPVVDVASIMRALPAPRRRARSAWYNNPAWRAAAAVIFLAVGGSAVLHYRGQPVGGDSLQAVTAAADDSTRDVELSVGLGLGDLSDAQLQALLTNIQQMDAVPLAEPDMTHPMVTLDNGGV